MSSLYLIHATGLLALSLNVSGFLRPNDRSLRVTTGWAAAVWALNNLLLGAHSAAALSILSVGRQAGATALQERPARQRAWTCAAFALLTALISLLTWDGITTLFGCAGSLVATYAMFHLRGTSLRLAMVLVASLWMVHAVVYDSWWQMIANTLAGGAAAFGAWKAQASAR